MHYHKMYILGVCWVLLYFGLNQNLVSCTDWTDDIMGQMVKNSGLRQVKFMTRLGENEYFDNPVIEQLYVKLVQNVPTFRINFGKDFELSADLVHDYATGTKMPTDTSPTLFIFAIESPNTLPIPTVEKFIDVVTEMTAFHNNPKFLVVSSVREPSKSLEELLRYAWNKNMFDLTIIELARPEIQRTLIGIKSSVPSLIVHKFDSFKKEYTRKVRGSDPIDLFPNKVNNLRGYPLRIGGRREFDLKPEIDPNYLLLRTIIQQLNCSVEFVELSETELLDPYAAAESHNLDLIPQLVPYDSADSKNDQRTVPILTEGVYFLVPILTSSEIVVSPTFLYGWCLAFGIIAIFWIFMRLLGIRSYPWRVYNIGRVLFGLAIFRQPTGNVERIVFITLLAVFAFHSSTIYGSITVITLQKTSEMEFETLEDIAKSGLTIKSDRLFLERTSNVFVGPLNVSRDRFVEHKGLIECAKELHEFKNVTCLTDKLSATVAMLIYNYEGPPTMKLAKPCLWTYNYGFVMKKRSPFRSAIDKVITRAHGNGFIDEFYYMETNQQKANWSEQKRQKPRDLAITSGQLMIIPIVGYTLSFIVFLCEIIYHRISMYMKSRVRPLRPPAPHAD